MITTLSSFERKELVRTLAQYRPELWRRCYPRIYNEPSSCGKYWSAKEVGAQLLSAALRVEREGLAGQTEIAETVWTSCLVNLRVPIYWIGRDMAQAIQQTIPPVTFDWGTADLPFDAMVFMVPKGVLKHEDSQEGEAVFISFVRVRNGDEIPSASPAGPRFFNMMEDAFSCFGATGDGALMHWTFAVDKELTHVNLAELDKLVQDGFPDHTTFSPWSGKLTQADNRFMARVSHLIFGTILMMLTKPEYLTPATLHKRVAGKAHEAPKEFWNPNVIGLHYHIRREWQGGTHASPRLHWVRGAYKEQPYGEKFALRKRIWIEPYLRGIDEEQ